MKTAGHRLLMAITVLACARAFALTPINPDVVAVAVDLSKRAIAPRRHTRYQMLGVAQWQ